MPLTLLKHLKFDKKSFGNGDLIKKRGAYGKSGESYESSAERYLNEQETFENILYNSDERYESGSKEENYESGGSYESYESFEVRKKLIVLIINF